ncbi:MAG: hypothetical protein GY851_20085 [bacterium]|nr:hypothetical protein [bacterium]
MDLSKLKWPLIIGVVALGIFLISDPGVNWIHQRYLSYTPGVDVSKNEANEAGLSRLGGFLLKTFRYEKAQTVFNDALRLYPEGETRYYNLYRKAKCAEKLNNITESVRLLRQLQKMDAHSLDERVPEPANLKLRADKLMEMNDLGEIEGTL